MIDNFKSIEVSSHHKLASQKIFRKGRFLDKIKKKKPLETLTTLNYQEIKNNKKYVFNELFINKSQVAKNKKLKKINTKKRSHKLFTSLQLGMGLVFWLNIKKAFD